MPMYGTNYKSVGPQEDLLTKVKKQKLNWHGYIIRSTGLAKATLQGTVKGKRKRGRRRRRREGNITEWTEKALNDNLRRAEDRALA